VACPSDALPQLLPVTPFSQGIPGTALPPGWARQTFPRIASHTRYTLVGDGDKVVVRAEAVASASGLVSRVSTPAAEARMLRWRWKVDRLPQGANTSTKAGDDAPARIYVTFQFDPAKLGPVDRLLYEAARAIYGEAPPHASLMYVWDVAGASGRSFANPYTPRVRTIVVEGGQQRLGQWLDYERDIVADYRYTGLTLRRHPVALLRSRLESRGIVTAAGLRELPTGATVRTAGLVITRQRPGSAQGVTFVTLEDETGSINLIVWRDVAERQRRALVGSRLMGVVGELQVEGEVVHVIAHRLVDLSAWLGALAAPSRDFH